MELLPSLDILNNKDKLEKYLKDKETQNFLLENKKKKKVTHPLSLQTYKTFDPGYQRRRAKRKKKWLKKHKLGKFNPKGTKAQRIKEWYLKKRQEERETNLLRRLVRDKD